MKKGIYQAGLAILLLWALTASVDAVSRAPVPYGKALYDAEQVAALNPAWSVVGVAGDSMEPYFGERSTLVIGKIEFAEVRAGMTIVFLDRDGDLVSHHVVELTPEGLRTKGYRNFRSDPEPVTAANFRGVVVAAFHSQQTPAGTVYASNGQVLPVVHGKRY